MADQIITYEYALANLNQFAKKPIPNTKRCMTKAIAIEYLFCDESLISGYSSDRLVPRVKIVGLYDGFDIGTGFNDGVYSIDTQPDGKILVGGVFTSFNGSDQNRITRLNKNGSIDTTFNTGGGFPDWVASVLLQPDGKILVGGRYPSFFGLGSTRKLVRLNSDGSNDSTFDTGTGFSGAGTDKLVYTLTLQSDGKILAGGYYTSFNNSTQNMLVRLNSDGSKDATFNLGSGFDDWVNSIAVQSDGKVLVGGKFTSFNSSYQSRLIRLNSNGSKDTSFNIGSGPDDWVNSIVLQPDGKILIGGNFFTFGSSSQHKLIRLHSDGSKDTTFEIGNGFFDSVNFIALQPDGKILVGGLFSTFNGLSQNRLIRLNSNGSKDTSFNIGTGFDAGVNCIKLQSNGKILVGGNFQSFNSSSQNYLIRLNSDGTKNVV